MASNHNIEMGKKYLQQIYSAISPRNYSIDQMVKALRTSNGGEELSVEDWNDWLNSLGFIVNEATKISNRSDKTLLTHLRKTLSQNKNWLPTRKTIDSFFMTQKYVPSYWDISKAVVIGVSNSGKDFASGTVKFASGVKTTLSVGSKIIPIAIVAVSAIILNIWWKNRNAIFSNIQNKIANKVTGGLLTKNNPNKGKKRRKKIC